jgi:ArsR family transcriptional regulator, arsenate/arsenite/antimonite-responsive transcriptional repressor
MPIEMPSIASVERSGLSSRHRRSRHGDRPRRPSGARKSARETTAIRFPECDPVVTGPSCRYDKADVALSREFSTYLNVEKMLLSSTRLHAPGRGFSMRKNALAVVSHVGPTPQGGGLSAPHALAALAGLGQATRLEVFRLLMRSEPDGLPAGSIAEILECPHNTLSSHLAILARSGLVRGTRDGRSIIYRADVEAMKALIVYLANDCCDGHPELCDVQDALRAAGCGCKPPAKAGRKGIKR